jgi:hypothetical protein
VHPPAAAPPYDTLPRGVQAAAEVRVGFLGALKPTGGPMVAAVKLRHERWWAFLSLRLSATMRRCGKNITS